MNTMDNDWFSHIDPASDEGLSRDVHLALRRISSLLFDLLRGTDYRHNNLLFEEWAALAGVTYDTLPNIYVNGLCRRAEAERILATEHLIAARIRAVASGAQPIPAWAQNRCAVAVPAHSDRHHRRAAGVDAAEITPS